MKTFMKDICHITGVDLRNKHITNHSGRKTLIQILQKKEKDRNILRVPLWNKKFLMLAQIW